MNKLKIFAIAIIFCAASEVFGANYQQTTIISACSMAGNCTSIGLDLNQMTQASIEAVFTGSPTGTLTIQVSADNVSPCNQGQANCVTYNPGGNVVNWVTYTGSSEPVASSGNFLYNLGFAGYRWLRLVYTASSGSGSLSATYNAKSYTQ